MNSANITFLNSITSFLCRQGYVLLLLPIALTSCEIRPGNNSEYEVSVGAKEERNIDRGNDVFQRNCASCHNRMKEATGPALNRELVAQHSDEWIITLLTDQKHLKKDSLYRKRVKAYGMSCYESRISKEEVLDVLAYIRGPRRGCVR